MNVFKEAGKMVVTLSIIATAIYILVEHTKQWPATIVLAVILVVWLQLVYHLFKRVNVSGNGVTLDGGAGGDKPDALIKELQGEINKLKKSDESLNERIEQTNERITKLHPAPKKLTFDEMMGIQIYVDNIDAHHMTYSDMHKDGPYDSFCHQVAFAKENNVELGGSENYRKILSVFQSVICDHLLAQLTLMYGNEVNSFKDTIKRALKQYPYSRKTLLAVEDDITEDCGKRSQCTLLFDEAINKLDKMY